MFDSASDQEYGELSHIQDKRIGQLTCYESQGVYDSISLNCMAVGSGSSFGMKSERNRKFYSLVYPLVTNDYWIINLSGKVKQEASNESRNQVTQNNNQNMSTNGRKMSMSFMSTHVNDLN